MEAQWLREYEYRRAFQGLTHEQYLDEPMEAIRWLTHIHAAAEKEKARQRDEANRRAG